MCYHEQLEFACGCKLRNIFPCPDRLHRERNVTVQWRRLHKLTRVCPKLDAEKLFFDIECEACGLELQDIKPFTRDYEEYVAEHSAMYQRLLGQDPIYEPCMVPAWGRISQKYYLRMGAVLRKRDVDNSVGDGIHVYRAPQGASAPSNQGEYLRYDATTNTYRNYIPKKFRIPPLQQQTTQAHAGTPSLPTLHSSAFAPAAPPRRKKGKKTQMPWHLPRNPNPIIPMRITPQWTAYKDGIKYPAVPSFFNLQKQWTFKEPEMPHGQTNPFQNLARLKHANRGRPKLQRAAIIPQLRVSSFVRAGDNARVPRVEEFGGKRRRLNDEDIENIGTHGEQIDWDFRFEV